MMKNPPLRTFAPFVVMAVLAMIALGFGVLVSPERASELIRYGGYWFILLWCLLFGGGVYGVARRVSRERLRKMGEELRKPAALLVMGLLILVFLFIRWQEPAGYKIVMDEPVLQGIAYSMHHDREALVPTRMHRIDGVPTVLDGYVDKRPIFFPFLVSLAHDLTGYRVENSFHVNTFLTLLFLGLILVWGRILGGWWGSALGLLLVAGFPLLIRFANSGGFEFLNLVFLLGTMLAAYVFARWPGKETLTLFCLTAVGLTQVRYESSLYLLPVALLILLVFWRERRVWGSWGFYASPLLLVPLLWVFQAFGEEKHWQMFDFEGVSKPFGLEFVASNLATWGNYFFAWGPEMPNSALLSFLGIAAILLFLVGLWQKRKEGKTPISIGETVLAVFLLGFLVNAVLQVTYFYGQFDNIIVRRLSLPLQLPFVLCLVVVTGWWSQWRKSVRAAALLGAVLMVFVQGVPKTGPAKYSAGYLSGASLSWSASQAREFRETGQDYFVLSEFPTLWIVHEVEASYFGFTTRYPNNLAFYLSHEGNQPVLVDRRLLYNTRSGEWEDAGHQTLPSFVQTEPFRQVRFPPVRSQALEKVVGLEGVALEKISGYESEEHFRRQWKRRLP